MSIDIRHTDALTLLRSLEDCSVDSIVCDPPSGISFMGAKWDAHNNYEPQTDTGKDVLRFGSALLAPWEIGFAAFIADVFSQCLRVIKPGGHALVWALPRTSDLTALGLRAAGWEIRDSLHHLFGSGFPKSADVSKAIDKAAGAERKVVGTYKKSIAGMESNGFGPLCDDNFVWKSELEITKPATPLAQQWEGWGTALKPSHEVWWMARKPIRGTVAANVLQHGTGAINIDACRVASNGDHKRGTIQAAHTGNATSYQAALSGNGLSGGGFQATDHDGGRWPSNLVLTHSADCAQQCVKDCPVSVLGEQSGESVSVASIRGGVDAGPMTNRLRVGNYSQHNDKGTAARYFPQFKYCAKPSRAEREAGCAHLPAWTGAEVTGRADGSAGLDNPRAGAGAQCRQPIHNTHPTVKSIKLMRWLTRLVTPPQGLVCDPFVGSGTTALACIHEGFSFIGSEQSAQYVKIAQARVDHADPAGAQARRTAAGQQAPQHDPDGQGRLF